MYRDKLTKEGENRSDTEKREILKRGDGTHACTCVHTCTPHACSWWPGSRCLQVRKKSLVPAPIVRQESHCRSTARPRESEHSCCSFQQLCLACLSCLRNALHGQHQGKWFHAWGSRWHWFPFLQTSCGSRERSCSCARNTDLQPHNRG